MTNEIELSDEQLAAVTGGKHTHIKQSAHGSLQQSNTSIADTTVKLNANHNTGDITLVVVGASVGQSNTATINPS